MSIQKLAVLAAISAIAAFGVLALGAGSASATTLRLDPGNTAFSGATTITNTTSHPATLATNLGHITCANTRFLADVTSHAAAGAISGSLTQLTFTACIDTIAPINITTCALHAGSPAPTVSILGTSAAGGSMHISNAVVRCSIQNSTSGCYYSAATAIGTANNAASSIAFPTVAATTVQPTTDALAAGFCASASTFRVTVTHVVQTGTNKTVTVSN